MSNRSKNKEGKCPGVDLFRLLVAFLFAALYGSTATVFSQTLPTWQARWDQTLAGAQREGKVVVFGPAGETLRNALVDAFKKSYPQIKLEYAGGRAAEQAMRLKAERDGNVFSVDVFIGGSVTLMDLGLSGALEPLEPALILPAVKEPKNWRDGRLEFTNPATRLTLVFSSQPNPPLIFNPRLAKVDELDELYELLDPKWTGRFVFNDPWTAGPGGSFFRWLWFVLGPDKATDFFTTIRRQAGAIDRDQRRQIEWVALGKYAWLLGPNNAMLHQLAQRGLKFAVLPEFRDYGTHVGTGAGCIALIGRAPHPYAAQLFINWLLDKPGQTVWSQALNLQTRRLDVPLDHIPAHLILKPGAKYWVSYYEKDAYRSPRELATLKRLFGR